MNRPNVDELMKLAVEASEQWGAIPRDDRPAHHGPVCCADSASRDLANAKFELSKDDTSGARAFLLRALYLIGGALSAGNATTLKDPRNERTYTRAEVEEMLGRAKEDIDTLGKFYHCTRDAADANLRRAIAAEHEMLELRAQIELLLGKRGA